MSEASLPSSSATASKLSIYDSPSEPLTLIPIPPSALQLQVSSLRRTSESIYNQASSSVNKASAKFIGIEGNISQQLSALHAKDEQLTSNLSYIGVSTLLGSIISRNSLFPLRIFTPLAALTGSFFYFLPKTASNVAAVVDRYEAENMPGLHKQQHALWRTLRSLPRSITSSSSSSSS